MHYKLQLDGKANAAIEARIEFLQEEVDDLTRKIYELEGNVESAIEYYTRASFQGDKESGVKADKLTKKANDMKKTLDRVNQKIN